MGAMARSVAKALYGVVPTDIAREGRARQDEFSFARAGMV